MREVIKGWFGEKLTTFGMWLRLDSGVYRRIHNIIVLDARNHTTQIDHVLVSIYGVFVIETKNMDGWIFGSAEQEMWTQQLFRKRFQFQNPLRQNYRHTQCLSEFLGLDSRLLRPVVFFFGDAELKSTLPKNVLTKGLSDHIKSFTQPVLTPGRVVEIERELQALKTARVFCHADHVKSLKERYRSVTTCPRCGGALVKFQQRYQMRHGDVI